MKNAISSTTAGDNSNNNEYANQTIYNTTFSAPDDQFTVSSQAAIMEPGNHEFCYIPKNVQTLRQGRIQTHGNE